MKKINHFFFNPNQAERASSHSFFKHSSGSLRIILAGSVALSLLTGCAAGDVSPSSSVSVSDNSETGQEAAGDSAGTGTTQSADDSNSISDDAVSVSSGDQASSGNTSSGSFDSSDLSAASSTSDDLTPGPGSRRVLPSESEIAQTSQNGQSGSGVASQSSQSGTASSGTTDSGASGDTSSDEPIAIYPSSLSEVVPAEKITGGSVMFVPKSNVKDTVITVKKDDSYPDSKEDVDEVLKGLEGYWADNNLDAVDYLIRMDKFRYLSGTLEGTNDYYYYGDENADGNPDGTGVAVYADNQYYYGSFSDGQREGKGYWYQAYMKNGRFYSANNGIYGHSYNGEWKNNLPDGQGQEHVDIDSSEPEERVVTNMIGTFTGGYYNGDFTVVSVSKGEGEINWQGTCRLGTWVPFENTIHTGRNGEQEVRVLQNLADEDNYFYMLKEENHGQGIYGLIPAK